MTALGSIKQELDEAAAIIRMQTARIAVLEAEVERLQAAGGAHSVLKNIYLDRAQPESLRAKAATAALPHETPKLMPERAPLDLVAERTEMSLFDLAEARRKKQEGLRDRDIEVRANGQVILLPRNGGNGSDD